MGDLIMTTLYKNGDTTVFSADVKRLMNVFDMLYFHKSSFDMFSMKMGTCSIHSNYISYKGELIDFESVTMYHGDNSVTLSITLQSGDEMKLYFECAA